MASVIVIGGGVIGLCSAYYLLQQGHNITIVDKSDMLDGCSYGNAGYICPSHFVPMATPGIVKQGLKWMADSRSPFYVQPRLSMSLIDWGLKFIRSASNQHIKASAIPLRDISVLSKKEYEKLIHIPGFDFCYVKKGLLDVFKTEENAHHAEAIVEASKNLGLEASLLNNYEVQQMEPGIKMDIKGAVYYTCDAHLHPNKLMEDMIAYLRSNGVDIKIKEEVTNFIVEGNRIKGLKTNSSEYFAEHIVLSAGAWSREVAARLNLKIPMVSGRGYSVTFENSPYKINYPVILSEARVAITPMAQNKIRFGGTMEITSFNSPPKMGRVKGILDSVKKYFPEFDIPMPSKDKVWYGYRPCSADGLPYIGKVSKFKNLIIATGHSMLGLSLGAGTGKLVSEIINNELPSMNIGPFNPDRFK